MSSSPENDPSIPDSEDSVLKNVKLNPEPMTDEKPSSGEQLRNPFGNEITLNIDDPIERVLIEIVQLNRKKRHDYADDNDIFSNFREAGEQTNTDALTVCEMHIATKQAHLKNLTKKSVMPKNESIRDTRLDRAVYSVIAVALNDSSI